jgi:membrane fusion protein (multidrug efflux system)
MTAKFRMENGGYWHINAIILTVLALSLDGCGKPPPPSAAVAASPVTVYTVHAKTQAVTYEFVAQTQSDHAVEIRARISGYLIRRAYKEGGVVKAGDLLFEIDHKPFQAQLDAAKAELAQEQARLLNANANLARVRPLAKVNALSQKELDEAISEQQQAIASVAGAQAKVETQALNLSYTYIRSPIDGVTDQAQQQEGAYVSTGTSSQLTTVWAISPIRVVFNVSETQLLEMQQGVAQHTLTTPPHETYTVNLVLADDSAYPQTGRMTFAGPTFDQKTGTFQARAEIPNPKGILRPGQFVRAKVVGAMRPGAIMVLQRAVLHGAKGDFVYVVSADNTAELRPVIAAEQSNGAAGPLWRIAEGLHEGDTVVVDGAGRLTGGTPLKVTGAAPLRVATDTAAS